MNRDFNQIQWDETVDDDCRQIVRLAIREDLDRGVDLTTSALVPADATGAADIVSRASGVIAGLQAVATAIDEANASLEWTPSIKEGASVEPGICVARLEGSLRDLLTLERIILNLLGRLSGIATGTRQFVDKVAGTKAHIYDTRKTTPGWRRLEKYAVRLGGGRNHRTGLFDAVLIKDNHLAFGEGGRFTPAEAVQKARLFLAGFDSSDAAGGAIVEIEIDAIDSLHDVLAAGPDIVLLDNMSCEQLRKAVEIRDQTASSIELDASGGISLDSVGQIAATGVERISVGQLTHSARCLDLGLDWAG